MFNIIYFIANTFSRYYTIYYSATLGATPFMLSMATMVSGLAEIPFFWYAGKIQKKLGIERYLIMAALSLVAEAYSAVLCHKSMARDSGSRLKWMRLFHFQFLHPELHQ